MSDLQSKISEIEAATRRQADAFADRLARPTPTLESEKLRGEARLMDAEPGKTSEVPQRRNQAPAHVPGQQLRRP